MLYKLFSRRRINVYFKFSILILLAIFYFTFLFRESLQAFDEANKERTTPKVEIKTKPAITRIIRHAITLKKIDMPNDLKDIATKAPSTLNPVYEYSEEIHSATEKELKERKSHLTEVCSKQELLGKFPPKPWEFFVSPGHSLVWCNIFKAASSTWMYYFNILGGYDLKYLQRTKTSPLELARKRFPRPHLTELYDSLATSLTFLTVREPFERLLSAYRDKLEGCRNKFYKVLGKGIIRKFRKASKLKRHNSGPTFKEFLNFLIAKHRKGEQFDEHWAPIYSFCTPCSINFTIVAKVETFERDSEFIIRQAGLEPLLLGKLPKSKMRKISNQSVHNTGSLIERYFSQIDRTTLDEVLKIYQTDFDLFGYNTTKYYDMVQPPPIVVNTTQLPDSNFVSYPTNNSNPTEKSLWKNSLI